jgi:geranylgeranyl reductase family protein
MPVPYDVAVVGAGPAGAWAAHLLARRGARVVLADPSHPREKPCGGGVTERALSLVASAPADDGLPAVGIRSARFVDTAATATATVSLAGSGGGKALVVASRAEFDGRLLARAERAGASVLADRVREITREGGGFRLETADGTIARAAWVVGADGANSLVRRRLAQPFRRDQLSIATGFFARGLSSDEIVVEFADDPPGYIWSFPRPDHLAIGICADAGARCTASDLRSRVSRWIRATGIAANAPLEPYSWPIPSLSPSDLATLSVAGPGWLLVGDAAGLVDPITREGIFFALQSGAFAADALAATAGRPDLAYGDRVRAEIAGELARSARIKASFFRPRFTRMLIDALARSEGIRAVMADLIAGRQRYEGLEWRLARTFELSLLWRLLQLRTGSAASRLEGSQADS